MADTPRRNRLTARGSTLSKDNLMTRLGQGAGRALFERLDDDYLRGEQVVLAGVKEARASFASLGTGRARMVKAQRPARGRETSAAETMVLIGLSDLEAVVHANDGDFSWIDAFAARPDLPQAGAKLTLKPGARGRNVKL